MQSTSKQLEDLLVDYFPEAWEDEGEKQQLISALEDMATWLKGYDVNTGEEVTKEHVEAQLEKADAIVEENKVEVNDTIIIEEARLNRNNTRQQLIEIAENEGLNIKDINEDTYKVTKKQLCQAIVKNRMTGWDD